MADRTLTINHADGDSETYTIKRDKFAGVREMSRGHVYPLNIVNLTSTADFTFTKHSDNSFTATPNNNANWKQINLIDNSEVRTGNHLIEFDLMVSSGSIASGDFYLLARDGDDGADSNIKSVSAGHNSIEIVVNDDGISAAEGDFDPTIAFTCRPASTFDVTISNLKVTHEPDTVTVDRTAVPKEQSKETTFGGSKSITIKREIEPLLTKVAGGASAAYSLRDLNDRAGNNKVVRVRRASDNHEKDFTAKEVSNGTLQNWTNAQVTPPLDLRELTATGRDGPIIDAAAAYSLRNLSDSYTGNVVEVRRSSDDATRSFTAAEVADGTLVAWVNASIDKLDLQAGSLDAFITNETATGFDFSVNNVGSNKFKNLLSAADTTAGTYTATLDVVLNSGSLTGCNLFHISSGSAVVTPLTAGANSISLTSDAGADIFFYILGTAVADVSITNITLTQTTADGTVSKWYDQSTTAGTPNANHAVQTDAASQPKIVDAGVLVTGATGKPAFTGDAVDDILSFSSSVDFGTKEFFVSTVVDVDTFGALIGSAIPNWLLALTTTSIQIRSSNTNTIYVISPDSALTAGQSYLISILRAGNDITAYVNGVAQSDVKTVASTEIFSADRLLQRGTNNNPYPEPVSEVILYNSDQTDNRTAIEANIGEVYSIAGIPAYDDTVNGFVETWYDQSGNGNDATQLTASYQPKIVDAGVLVTGGILSDGAGTFLELDSTLSISDEFDIFFTGTATASDWTGLQRSPYGFSTNSDYPRFNDDSFRYTISNSDSGTIDYNSGFTIGAGTPFLYNFNRDVSDSVGAQINGTAQTNRVTLTGTHQISQLFRRGANTWQIWDGTMSEMIFYNSDQSANREAIETNINNQYDIY